ncbi:hypothetical protein JAAARDRAFT_209958 [Jaapia argillacea MUCL 33604]|uniref:Uncharacterized protein n=1 Tax=Jaapia argillacea MUCL 33604 TaxID=933084 RepID=A0A067PFQ9_9AGAM|nr:hypothetical protein JAAARDRAFT_209958 [Jaapia argillacea MUCL 33604]
MPPLPETRPWAVPFQPLGAPSIRRPAPVHESRVARSRGRRTNSLRRYVPHKRRPPPSSIAETEYTQSPSTPTNPSVGLGVARATSVIASWPGRIERFHDLASAAGLPVSRTRDPVWRPTWNTFELAVFRRSRRSILKIQREWDDEMLLVQLRRKYYSLRPFWRRCITLTTIKTIALVPADVFPFHVYPQTIGDDPSISKCLRFRHYLRNPQIVRGRLDFMRCLTESPDRGVQFLDRWSPRRIIFLIVFGISSTLAVGLVVSHVKHDYSTGFTVAGWMVSALALLGACIGVLNFVEFR